MQATSSLFATADASEQCKRKKRKAAAEAAPVAASSPAAKAAGDTGPNDEQRFAQGELVQELDQKMMLTTVTIANASKLPLAKVEQARINLQTAEVRLARKVHVCHRRVYSGVCTHVRFVAILQCER